MPIVKKFKDAEFIRINEGIQCKNILQKDDLDDSRITIDYYNVFNKSQLYYSNNDSDISWIQILSGGINMSGKKFNKDQIILIKGKGKVQLNATQDTELVITKIDNYKMYENNA